ncbi:MAG: Bax inhibitor-1/YccA family protein [Deltaproteobacteria bacterium]|nr:Bax inhibitor-1/YccA family protein [Deltaproteobacteria bacterium]
MADYRARAFAGEYTGAVSQTQTEFIHKTYQHLGLAILAFMAVEAALFKLPGIDGVVRSMMSSRMGWLLVLGGYMAVSWVAERWAQSASSVGMQYLGLGVFVLAEAVIFLPLLWMAIYLTKDPSVVGNAAIITLVTFGGLTATMLISKKDMSRLGGFLRIAGFGALGLIVASAIFGFTLGTLFSFGMAIFACGAIVYETSNVMHRYRPGQHVAASLALFASVALLFWYILRLLMSLNRR